MCRYQKTLCWENRSTCDVENHLTAKPATNGGLSLKVIRKYSSKRSGYFQASVENYSNLCCSVYALSTIASWVIGKSVLDDMNKVHPLVNLSEISFGHFHCVPEACSQLYYHTITASDNFADNNLISLNLLFPRRND